MQKGDRLVLYTDGLTDVVNEQGQFSGRQGLEGLVRTLWVLPLARMCQALFDALDDIRGQAEPFDDMTLMILEVNAD